MHLSQLLVVCWQSLMPLVLEKHPPTLGLHLHSLFVFKFPLFIRTPLIGLGAHSTHTQCDFVLSH